MKLLDKALGTVTKEQYEAALTILVSMKGDLQIEPIWRQLAEKARETIATYEQQNEGVKT